mgnify:CR=1 FL=1
MLLLSGSSPRVRRWTLNGMDMFITGTMTPKPVLQSYLCNIVIIHTNSLCDLWSTMNKNIFVVTTFNGVAREASLRGANVLMESSLGVALHRILSYRYTDADVKKKN